MKKKQNLIVKPDKGSWSFDFIILHRSSRGRCRGNHNHSTLIQILRLYISIMNTKINALKQTLIFPYAEAHQMCAIKSTNKTLAVKASDRSYNARCNLIRLLFQPNARAHNDRTVLNQHLLIGWECNSDTTKVETPNIFSGTKQWLHYAQSSILNPTIGYKSKYTWWLHGSPFFDTTEFFSLTRQRVFGKR